LRVSCQAPPLFHAGGSREVLDKTPGAEPLLSAQPLAITRPPQYQKLVPTKPAPRMPSPTQSHTDDALPSVPGISPT
jgi:hypothetical protein